MTKELSKQICEICGIPFEKSVNLGWTYPKYKYSYLDFSEAENFVKLLELKILNGCSLWAFLSLKDAFVDKRTTFLNLLCSILSGEVKNFLDENTINSIKQAIREAEWKYE